MGWHAPFLTPYPLGFSPLLHLEPAHRCGVRPSYGWVGGGMGRMSRVSAFGDGARRDTRLVAFALVAFLTCRDEVGHLGAPASEPGMHVVDVRCFVGDRLAAVTASVAVPLEHLEAHEGIGIAAFIKLRLNANNLARVSLPRDDRPIEQGGIASAPVAPATSNSGD